jgi:hypothetical protein
MAGESQKSDLRVGCVCGEWLPVQSSDTGGAVKCSCGRRVEVPLLEEFDGRPNLPSAPTVEDRIAMLIADGELPPLGGCARCGHSNSAEKVDLKLECERYTAYAHGGDRFIIIPFFLFTFWMWWSEEKRLEIVGRDTFIAAPICLCKGCQSLLRARDGWSYFGCAILAIALGGTIGYFDWVIGLVAAMTGLIAVAIWKRLVFTSRQKHLKTLLRKVPVYKQVLTSYPLALVIVPPQRDPDDPEKPQWKFSRVD